MKTKLILLLIILSTQWAISQTVTHVVSGTILYNNSAYTYLGGVVLKLMNGTTQVATTTTNAIGAFSFANINDGVYSIVATTTIPWGGVTSTDVLKMRRHVAGLELLTDPIRFSAADPNNSITITSTDVLKVQRRIAGLDAAFIRPDWIFEKPTTGGITITVSGADISVYLYGLCTGDVNGSYLPISITVPIVNTTAISNITPTTATGGGEVTNDGGSSVTSRGICWSTTLNPTIANSYTSNGTDLGIFTSSLTGLTAGAIYYVRAYATNGAGTGYGSQLTFNTLQSVSLPTVNTTAISNITQITANSGGNVTNDGGASITARGICWSTIQNPTITDSFTNDGTGLGIFTSNLTGLSVGTIYYVRAYSTNSSGTAYGNEISFTTMAAIQNCGILTDVDGNTYNTVLIGTQCWMRENLKATHYSNGTAMVDGTSAGDITGNYITKYYFDYNNNSINTTTYGKLYTWAAAMNGAASSTVNPSGVQGVCPTAWHVPSDAEWTQLTDNLGGVGLAGGKMKEAGTTHWSSTNTGTDNSSGFTALPGGNREIDGYFYSIRDIGFWWSASENFATSAWFRKLQYGSSNVYRSSFSVLHGYSVRCLRDF